MERDKLNYNAKFVCTYKDIIENGKDVDNLSTLCYQLQLLEAFNMKEYEHNILERNIDKLWNILRENTEIKEILSFLSKKSVFFDFLKSKNEKVEDIYLFHLLFSYDYFNVLHSCLSKYLDNNNKNVNYFVKLKEYIKSN
jgi:DNA repair ATPase RecN